MAQRTQEATFGHLAPEKNTTYKGTILFCKSAYNSGTLTLIDMSFGTLADSPFIYGSVYNWLYEMPDLKDGSVYEVKATLRNYRFWGKPILKCSITAQP